MGHKRTNIDTLIQVTSAEKLIGLRFFLERDLIINWAKGDFWDKDKKELRKAIKRYEGCIAEIIDIVPPFYKKGLELAFYIKGHYSTCHYYFNNSKNSARSRLLLDCTYPAYHGILRINKDTELPLTNKVYFTKKMKKRKEDKKIKVDHKLEAKAKSKIEGESDERTN